MLIPTIVMGVIAGGLVLYAYLQGEGKHVAGLSAAAKMTVEILPLLVFALIVAGMVPILLDKAMVARWVGQESGLRGILIGTVAGCLSPGGPFVALPVAAGLMRSGASVGTLVAYVTSWSVLGFSRWPLEVGILGWRFVAIRVTCSFLLPLIAGLMAQAFFAKALNFGAAP